MPSLGKTAVDQIQRLYLDPDCDICPTDTRITLAQGQRYKVGKTWCFFDICRSHFNNSISLKVSGNRNVLIDVQSGQVAVVAGHRIKCIAVYAYPDQSERFTIDISKV